MTSKLIPVSVPTYQLTASGQKVTLVGAGPQQQIVVPAQEVEVPAASMMAALIALGYAVTAPGGTTGPTTPTLPQSGPNVIYNGAFKGAEQWAGDWSGGGVKENYNDKIGNTVCLTLKAVAAYPMWIPYPALQANGFASFDTTPYTHFVMKLRKSGISDSPTLVSFSYTEVNGVFTGDIQNGAGVVLDQFVSAPADADGFITYTVPLANIQCLNMKNLYKVLAQDAQCPVGSEWAISYAAFV